MNKIELSLQELRELLIGHPSQFISSKPINTGKSHSFVIGKAYLIRTVTMHYTGRVVIVTDSDVVLEDAAWIADTGRYSDSLKTGSLSEVEPYIKPVTVSRGCIVDFTEWTHELPRTQK